MKMLRNIDIEKTAREIEVWIAQQVDQSRTTGVVIGLSGGIDSALAATLCVNALGRPNVHGMILPCYSSEDSVNDAQLIADVEGLGIDHTTVTLGPTYLLFYDSFAHDLPALGQLPRANLKSRLRMCALYAQANQLNRLVCGTTNLTEMIIGYFTKYGDGGIDIEPIAALLKCEVREMARSLGVPERIVTKSPSADLWSGQTDENELGFSYDDLDAAVLNHVSGKPGNRGDSTPAEKLIWERFCATKHKRALPPSLDTIVRK